MKYFQIMLELFYKITTGITCITAIYITIFWGADSQMSGTKLLWQILLTAALCALVGVLYEDAEKISKKGMLVRIGVGFIYVNIVVLCCGTVFEWFYPTDWKMFLGMEVSIIAVFIAVVALSYFSGRKTAEQINARLKERK